MNAGRERVLGAFQQLFFYIAEEVAISRADVSAAELTEEPGLLARAALGYADPGADLGIAYRTDDPVTGPLLERALAAQPAHLTPPSGPATDEAPAYQRLSSRYAMSQ